MAVAPSRGGLPFSTSPSYAPLQGRAAVGNMRPSEVASSDGSGSRKRGTPKLEETFRKEESGHERVSSGFEASTSESSAFQGLGLLREVERDNTAQQILPTIDEGSKKGGSRVAPSGPVSWGESLKYAVQSWLLGFWEALMIHRTVGILARSRPVLVRTSQCSLLNGFFFLGSIILLKGFLDPSLRYLLDLPRHSKAETTAGVGAGGLAALHSLLIVVYNMLWLYPIYVVSFVINCMWHQDIAKRAYQALQGDRSLAAALGVEPPDLSKPAPPPASKQGGSGVETLVTMIGEEVYRVVMFAVFVIQVYAVSIVPYVGPTMNFLLLSWLYAYYCYDYKWSSAGWSLDERLSFFETHWAFFAGFGAPCTIATYFLPFFASAAVWALIFPLFVLVATTSNPARVVSKSLNGDPLAVQKAQAWRVPVFRFAAVQSVVLLKFLLPSSREQQTIRS
ncbi:etoposide-induced 2.4 mRNA [Klebsormidium nitens]|uniref:Etoposide-induced 2.4 mRNA n=1 Tax=Klebsormidium nitens TaxID=105231 RepID=A0A1Y1IPX5_KLENI|nr:etoposide-induced 2.4 mRNA [Klebsormidium nitens]|eukprot:GAQ91271.1 etoposide-induced 2.4 mRNA [Klebsormidium nitens]